MKKAILITAGAILGTTSVISAGVFLPSLYLNSSPSTIKVDSNKTFISNKAQSSVSLKDAVMGTKQVNNGNYVLYFGSEGIDSNFKFLYKVTGAENTLEKAKQNQLENRNMELSGDYWSTINYVANNIKAEEELVRPEFIAYVNLLGKGVTDGQQRIADEATSCLKDVIAARNTYSKASSDEKTKLQDKYNFVKNMLKSDTTFYKFLGTSILEFYSILSRNFKEYISSSGIGSMGESIKNPNIADNATVYEAVNWTVLVTSVPLKTSPFDTYLTWDKQTKFYDQSSYTQEFRDLWDFIKSNPLFSTRKPKDITTNNGFILGYKDGKLTEFYDDSFDSAPTEGDGSESNPEEGTTYNSKDVAPVPPSTNSFYTWLSKQYSKKTEGENN